MWPRAAHPALQHSQHTVTKGRNGGRSCPVHPAHCRAAGSVLCFSLVQDWTPCVLLSLYPLLLFFLFSFSCSLQHQPHSASLLPFCHLTRSCLGWGACNVTKRDVAGGKFKTMGPNPELNQSCCFGGSSPCAACTGAPKLKGGCSKGCFVSCLYREFLM